MEPQLSSTIQAWFQTKPGTIQAWFQRKPAAILINLSKSSANFLGFFHTWSICTSFPPDLPRLSTNLLHILQTMLHRQAVSTTHVVSPRHHLREDPCPTGKHHLTGTLLFKMPNKKNHSNDLIKNIFS